MHICGAVGKNAHCSYPRWLIATRRFPKHKERKRDERLATGKDEGKNDKM
jgi:hypothetical protein